MKIVASIDEGLYYALWFEAPEERHGPTPRIVPTSDRGVLRPSEISYCSILHAEPIYIQSLGAMLIQRRGPVISEKQQCLLTPCNSAYLGLNCYTFVGRVVAIDKYQLVIKGGDGSLLPRKEWVMNYIVDCGIPLCFREEFYPIDDPAVSCWYKELHDGLFVEGIVRLSFSAFSARMGLHQSISGVVIDVEALELCQESNKFGKICPMEFGKCLSYDPEALLPQETIFMSFDIKEIGPLSYGNIPARSKDCPEPDYPGMVYLNEDKRFRIVHLDQD